MILTEQQRKAVQTMSTKFNNGDPITVIAGYAGTGKSSIINYFIENNDLLDKTRFVTYTGKASLVLQQKGLPATTIHSLIYHAFWSKYYQKFFFRKKPALSSDIKLIVIDEVSMVPNNILEDLMSYDIPIIALGDPGQLEPIGKDNGLLKNPDAFLTEVHRQGEDNSIIRLSMEVRQGKSIADFPSDDNVKIVDKAEVSIPMLMWADQILCGRNNTRHSINRDIRTHLGHTDVPVAEGEKMICLRNYWDVVNGSDDPLINGAIGTASNVEFEKGWDKNSIAFQNVKMDFSTDYAETDWEELNLDSNILKGHAPTKETDKEQYLAFDYGYAITTHKAQGSEFDKVLVFEERLGGNHTRWLYTAITRAANKIVIVKA